MRAELPHTTHRQWLFKERQAGDRTNTDSQWTSKQQRDLPEINIMTNTKTPTDRLYVHTARRNLGSATMQRQKTGAGRVPRNRSPQPCAETGQREEASTQQERGGRGQGRDGNWAQHDPHWGPHCLRPTPPGSSPARAATEDMAAEGGVAALGEGSCARGNEEEGCMGHGPQRAHLSGNTKEGISQLFLWDQYNLDSENLARMFRNKKLAANFSFEQSQK